MSTYNFYLNRLNDSIPSHYINSEPHDYHNEMVLKHHNGKFNGESNVISAVEMSNILEATKFKYRPHFSNCSGRDLNKWVPKNFKVLSGSKPPAPEYYLKFYRLIGYEPFTFEDRKIIIGEKIINTTARHTHIITDVWEENIMIAGQLVSFDYLLKLYTFFDGSPCGKMYLIEDYTKEFGECSKPVFPENTHLKENEQPGEKKESWKNCILDGIIESLKGLKV